MKKFELFLQMFWLGPMLQGLEQATSRVSQE